MKNTNAKTLIYDSSFFKWLGKGSLNAPASIKNTVIQVLGRNINFYFFRPLTYRLLPAIIGYKTIVVSVIRLLFSARPPAVTRLVVLVVVNSIKGVAFGGRTHVLIKPLEGVPALTHFNASTTVVFVVPLVRVITALSHINPRSIYGVSVGVILFPHKSHAVLSFSHVGRIS